MAGTKGCSGGYRPGAGRKPGATQIKSKPKSKGIKKDSKKNDEPPPDLSSKKLTSFFSKKPAAGGAAVENMVCATPLPQHPTVRAFCTLSLHAFAVGHVPPVQLTLPPCALCVRSDHLM